MVSYFLLGILGVAVGAIGTLIGAGGGFLLVPILLLLYPNENPEIITSMALAVVFCNALSGSVAYARMGRIDYRSGILFSLTSVPGSVLGALTTAALSRRLFDATFGVVILAGAALLAVVPDPATSEEHVSKIGRSVRTVVERNGTRHAYSYRLFRGLGFSAAIGYMSSLLGIGGGVIHVPAMIRFLNFPVHVATATSHFVLAVMAFAGTLVHVMTGSFRHGIRRTAALSLGVVLGAQFGAKFSSRLHSDWIIRGLAVALALVGIRILASAL